MNNLTIIFNAYYSKKSLLKVLVNLRRYKVIVVENSLDKEIKKEIEKKYQNVKVIIPKENLGVAKGYNLAIKSSKTQYVFLNNPDMKMSNKAITQLMVCAKKIKKFGMISPVYDDEKIYKNYSKYEVELHKSIFLKKNKISKVNWIDNNFIIDKKTLKKKLFDEKYFLYFETLDFCLNLIRKNKKLLIGKKIKFKHYGSGSTDIKYKNVVMLSRAWHYNWSKFYYYRKNYNYIYALTKIFPNFIRGIRKVVVSALKFDKFNMCLSLVELYGIMSSLLCLKFFEKAYKKI